MNDNVIILNRTPDDWKREFQRLFRGGGFFLLIIAALLVLFFLYSARPFYTVAPGEKGVVLRLGKHVRTKPAGFHFKLPWPIERVEKPNVQRIRNLTIGYVLESSARKIPKLEEALMLTGDENILHVELSVQYQINDPAAYLFNVKEQAEALKDICEASLRRVIGDYGVDAPLTGGKAAIEMDVREACQELCERYGLGFYLTAVQLIDVKAPGPVQAAFDAVTTSKENKQKYINQAEGYRNGKIPEAEGKAAAVINQASGYASERTLKAKGEVLRFSSVLAEYRKAKEVTQDRLYLETLEDVLEKVDVTIIDPNLGNVVPLLDLTNLGAGGSDRTTGRLPGAVGAVQGSGGLNQGVQK